MADDAQTAEQAARGIVSGEQLRLLERNFLAAIPVCIASILLSGFLFWDSCRSAVLLWIALAAPLALLRFGFAYRAAFEPAGDEPARLWQRPLLDIALWMAVFLPPVAMAFYYGHAVALYMSIVAAGLLWAGALTYSPVFVVAATFIGFNMISWLAVPAVFGGGEIGYRPMTLLLFMGVVALLGVRKLSRRIEQGLLQQSLFELKTNQLERRAEQNALLLHERESGASDWQWRVDNAQALIDVSDRLAAAFDRPADEIESVSVVDMLAADDVPKNLRARQTLARYIDEKRAFQNLVVPIKVGEERRWWSVSGHPVADAVNSACVFRGLMADVTAEWRARQEVDDLAHRDPLTGLLNRATFLDRLKSRVERSDAPGLAVICLDLDGFKLANEKYGHAVGDAVLVEAADRLAAAVSHDGLVARMSGDEFVIETPTCEQIALESLCQALVETISCPYRIEDLLIRIGVSVGVAVFPKDGTKAGQLISHADAALRCAKQAGRGRYRFFDHMTDQQGRARSEMLQDLREAVTDEQFVLHYQPIIASFSSEITGYEALIRWHHPERGMISPMDFIPLAEDSGLIVTIGDWVLNRACRDAMEWQESRRVAVNISVVQFQDPTLADRIRRALESSGLPPHLLEIELTESVLVEDIDEALAMLGRIRALGVKIALDDFGTGYSSLSYLRTLSFDRVKIDRSFVNDVLTEPGSAVIIRAVGDIAKVLGMTVIAEGVETREQADLLVRKGCQELQGFFYGRPVANANRLISIVGKGSEANLLRPRPQPASKQPIADAKSAPGLHSNRIAAQPLNGGVVN